MTDFDVEEFVAKLEHMGVKLTTVPLADGKMRINRWRMLHAVEARQIESLWASQIGDNQARIDRLAAHLARPTTAVTADRSPPPRAPLAAPKDTR
jgi:hypothetical protein